MRIPSAQSNRRTHRQVIHLLLNIPLVAILLIFEYFRSIVLLPTAAYLDDYNKTDVFIVGYALLVFSLLGFTSEIYALFTNFDVVRIPTFLMVSAICFIGLCYLSLSGYGIENHQENRDGRVTIEIIRSVWVRVFISFVGSLLIGGFVFTATLIQYGILLILNERSWALFKIGRIDTRMSRLRDDEVATALQQQQRAPAQDFDIDWTVFGDVSADLKAAYKREMKAAKEATDPVQIEHHLQSARLLIAKMTPDPKSLIHQKLLMIEDQRPKN